MAPWRSIPNPLAILGPPRRSSPPHVAWSRPPGPPAMRPPIAPHGARSRSAATASRAIEAEPGSLQLAGEGWNRWGWVMGGVRWRAKMIKLNASYDPPTVLQAASSLSLPQSVAFWSWIMEGARTSILKNKWKKYVMGHVTMWPPKLAVHYLAFFTSQLCKRRFMNADSSLVLVDAGGIINYSILTYIN